MTSSHTITNTLTNNTSPAFLFAGLFFAIIGGATWSRTPNNSSEKPLEAVERIQRPTASRGLTHPKNLLK